MQFWVLLQSIHDLFGVHVHWSVIEVSCVCDRSVILAHMECSRDKIGTTTAKGRDNVETTLDFIWKQIGSFGSFLGLLIKN